MSEKNENVKIQVASVDDAEELLAIYAPYVEKTAITFEYEVPSVEEFKGRIAHVLERFPYLKAVEAGKILGYAYVSPFKERAAYSWAVETSIYVDENVKHKGVGRKLHEALETVLKEQGILNMEACITKNRFKTTFTAPAANKKYNGRLVSPTALKRAAPKL